MKLSKHYRNSAKTALLYANKGDIVFNVVAIALLDQLCDIEARIPSSRGNGLQDIYILFRLRRLTTKLTGGNI